MTYDNTRTLGELGSNLTVASGIVAAVTAPAALDSSLNLATTGFLANSGARYSKITTKTTSTSLTVSDLGSLISATVTGLTTTLPAASACPSGTSVTIAYMVSSGTSTVAPNGSDTLSYGQGSSGNLTLNPGESVQFVSNGTNGWTSAGQTLSTGVTPAQFNNSTDLATTTFVQRTGVQYSSFVAVSGATTLTAADAGAYIYLNPTGPYTVTLPASSSFQPGATLTFFCSTSGVIIQRAGSDYIIGIAGNETSVTLNVQDTLTLMAASAGNWVAIGGSIQLGGSASFAISANSPGYQKLPSGLIIQWGSFSVTNGSGTTLSWPIAFTVQCFSVIGTDSGAAVNNYAFGLSGSATTGCTVYCKNAGTTTTGVTYWCAIGK